MRYGAPVLLISLLFGGCSQSPPAAADADLSNEIQRIRAIDNHAHPVRYTTRDEPADRLFDALPVDNMEPQSDPVNMRANAPAAVEAWRALYGYAYSDLTGEHLKDGQQRKRRVMRKQKDKYPEWVLDQLGVDVMLANRVTMGKSIQPPRFRWVPYADALMYPLDNAGMGINSDRKSFFALEDQLRARYLSDAGITKVPPTLSEYLSRVVTPTLEHQRAGGAVAEKFEAAYLRSLAFDAVERPVAEKIYAAHISRGAPSPADYKPLQDFLFRYIAAECGRLGMAVHIHSMAGAGGYFDVAGGNPIHLESVLDDPSLRKTRFVLVHGGWPFIHETAALLTKPNAYLDFSGQDLELTSAALAASLREFMEMVPEKVMFGTDAYPFLPEMGWEESGWIAARTGRQALAIALTGMMRDGEITRERASELARMALRDNARALYGLP